MKRYRDIIIGFILASAPILSLYRIGPLSVSSWLTLIAFLFLVKDKQYCLKPNGTSYIWRLAVTFSILSLNGMLLGYRGMSLISAVIVLIFETFMFLSLMGSSNPKRALQCFNVVGYICCFIAVYQCFAVISGFPYFSGRLPFFELDSSLVGWMKDSYGFRFNSLFSEPSYLAIFLLPLFAYSVKSQNYINSALFGFCLILSSSTTGILGFFIVFIYEICYVNLVRKKELKSLAFVAILVLVGGYFIVRNQDILTMFLRTSQKLTELNEGASDDRLFGGIELFFDLPIKEQLFGVGISQMGNYFKMYGKDIANYANTIVTTLINSGIIGFSVLLLFYYRMFKISKKNKNQVYFYLYLAVSCADPLLFNQRFYQFLYFILFVNFSVEKNRISKKRLL